MMKRMKRLAAALLGLLCVLCLPRPAAAYDHPIPDMSRRCSLTLDYGYPGASFRVYRAGDVTKSVILTPTGDFAKYGVTYIGLDSQGWYAMAETLAAYAARDRLTPAASGTTDNAGRLVFRDLEVGLYLVVGDRLVLTDTDEDGRVTTTYVTPQPFLICLPNWRKGIDTEWVYDLTVTPKHETSQEETISRRVLKVWDDGRGTDRPRQIKVQLLRDGAVYDTVTLSAGNNWRYQWDGLDNRYSWQVVESEGGEGCRVSVTLAGMTFVITNTLPGNPPGNPPDNPSENPSEPPAEIDIPDGPVPLGDMDLSETENPDDLVDIDDPDVPLANLPQTGQLWWPVPLLAMGGVFLFLLGCVRRKRSCYEE